MFLIIHSLLKSTFQLQSAFVLKHFRTSSPLAGRLLTISALCSVPLLLTNCSPKSDTLTPDGSSAVTSTFSSLYTNVFSIACLNCHKPGGAANIAGSSIDYTSQNLAYTTMKNTTVAGTSTANHCSTINIITPGNPNASYLVEQLVASYNKSADYIVTGCSPYPGHSANLMTSAEQQALVAWVQAGALDN